MIKLVRSRRKCKYPWFVKLPLSSMEDLGPAVLSSNEAGRRRSHFAIDRRLRRVQPDAARSLDKNLEFDEEGLGFGGIFDGGGREEGDGGCCGGFGFDVDGGRKDGDRADGGDACVRQPGLLPLRLPGVESSLPRL